MTCVAKKKIMPRFRPIVLPESYPMDIYNILTNSEFPLRDLFLFFCLGKRKKKSNFLYRVLSWLVKFFISIIFSEKYDKMKEQNWSISFMLNVFYLML